MILNSIFRYFVVSSGTEMGSISWDLFQLTPHLSVRWVCLNSMGSCSMSLSSIRRLMRILKITLVDCKDGFTSEMGPFSGKLFKFQSKDPLLVICYVDLLVEATNFGSFFGLWVFR